MRALVLDAPLERILQIGEITKPRIEKPYNVLVKVIAAGSIRLAGKTG
jgi:threonine dehydrogenase-like Zn-dependent dehydrogenase